MPLKVKDLSSSARKFTTRGAAAAQDYQAGVAAAGPQWERNTADSAARWAQAVTEAAGRGAFARGVAAAGPAKFAQRASTIGAQRFPQGIQAAGPDWEKGFAPFRDTLQSLDLPAKGLKNSPQNYTRVAAVGNALHARKVGA